MLGGPNRIKYPNSKFERLKGLQSNQELICFDSNNKHEATQKEWWIDKSFYVQVNRWNPFPSTKKRTKTYPPSLKTNMTGKENPPWVQLNREINEFTTCFTQVWDHPPRFLAISLPIESLKIKRGWFTTQEFR